MRVSVASHASLECSVARCPARRMTAGLGLRGTVVVDRSANAAGQLNVQLR